MFDWIKQEVLRFRKWCVITTALNTVFIGLGVYFDDYEQSGAPVGVAFTLLYSIHGLLLGWQQMRTWRQPNMWTYLLNRPCPPARLAASLVAAGVVLIAVSIVLPYLMLTALVDGLGWYVIDQRHYLQASYTGLLSVAAYLAAAYLTLANHKAAWAVLLVPGLCLLTVAQGGPMVTVAAIGVLISGCLLLAVFRANLGGTARGRLETVTLYGPFHLLTLWVLGAGVAFAHQVSLMWFDGAGVKVAWNHYFAADTYDHQTYASPQEQLQMALANAPEADHWQRQVGLSEVHHMAPMVPHFPAVGQWPYAQDYALMTLSDPHNDLTWVYQHDSGGMVPRIASQSRGTERPEQVLSEHPQNLSQHMFTAPPVVFGQQLITPQQLYAYDPYLQQLDLRFVLAEGEVVLTPAEQKGRYRVMLSSAALYLFANRNWQNSQGLQSPLLRLSLPGPHENLTAVTLTDLPDRMLVGFLFGRLAEQQPYPAQSMAYQVLPDFSVSHLSTQPLDQGFRPGYRFRGWWLSPLTQWAHSSLLDRHLAAAPSAPWQAWRLPPWVTTQWPLLAGLSGLSVLWAWWVLRRKDISQTARWINLILVLFTGLCGLLFCWLFYAHKPRLIAAKHPGDQS